jgi:hypothetical protein
VLGKIENFVCCGCCSWREREKRVGECSILAEVSNERNEVSLHVMRVIKIKWKGDSWFV